MPGRTYEEERLLLYVQEAIAEAIDKSGHSRAEIAERLGKNRSFVSHALSSGRNLTIASIASLVWAAGFRIRPELEAIDVRAALATPASAELGFPNDYSNIISIRREQAPLEMGDGRLANNDESGLKNVG